jgi:hypothetical protein
MTPENESLNHEIELELLEINHEQIIAASPHSLLKNLKLHYLFMCISLACYLSLSQNGCHSPPPLLMLIAPLENTLYIKLLCIK